MKAACQAPGLARSNIHRLQARPEAWIDARTRRTAPASDVALLDEIKAQITELPTYGYRRACALVNRHRANTGAPRVNGKPSINHALARGVEADLRAAVYCVPSSMFQGSKAS